jgi:hypothetical protein
MFGSDVDDASTQCFEIKTPFQKSGVFYFTSNDFYFIFVSLIKNKKI